MTRATSFNWFRLQFPSTVEPDQLGAFLRILHGLSSPDRTHPIVLQAVGRHGRIEHYAGLPSDRAAAVLSQATSTVPGLVFTSQPSVDVGQVDAAWRLWASSSRRPLRVDDPGDVSQALLMALAGAGRSEIILLQWMLGPARRPVVVPTKHSPLHSESWPRALATAAFAPPGDLDTEARRALRLKQGEPGWRAVGRIAVRAATPGRQRSLLGHLMGALRTAEGPGAHLGVRAIRAHAVIAAKVPCVWGLAVNISELCGLSTWPLGDRPAPGVARRQSRLLPVPAAVPRQGRLLAVEPTSERPIGLSRRDSLHHLWAVGPTGTGKSTLLLNLICQDMAAGHSLVVIEPKGDLIADVLARIPKARANDLVLLDPADAAPVGLNPLTGQAPADLVADQLLTIFARLNTDSWGPRLAELLHTALLTLARTPGMSLAALPPLLTNERFRRRLVGSLDDPLGVSPIWAGFERLSEEARSQAVAAVLNKVRMLTARPALRAVLGQAAPRFSVDELFSAKRPILLASLAKGAVGPDSARLLGTLLLNQLWQRALARQAVPAARRHMVSVFVDELQDYMGLPSDLGDMLAQARGLGVAFALANQHADQLAPALRSGVLANARSRVVFQTATADAVLLARGHREIAPEDFVQLSPHEAYLRLSVGGTVTPYMSGRTLPPPPSTSQPGDMQQRSRERYGVPRAHTDAALRELIEGSPAAVGAIGRARRST